MEDLLEQANEIQETLSRSYAVPDEIDEADLEAGKQIINSLRKSNQL
jgi:charged multivesicular body protein 5